MNCDISLEGFLKPSEFAEVSGSHFVFKRKFSSNCIFSRRDVAFGRSQARSVAASFATFCNIAVIQRCTSLLLGDGLNRRNTVKITFVNMEGTRLTIDCEQGDTLLQVARKHNLPIDGSTTLIY